MSIKKEKKALQTIQNLNEHIVNIKTTSIRMLDSILRSFYQIDNCSQKLILNHFNRDSVSDFRYKAPVYKSQLNQVLKLIENEQENGKKKVTEQKGPTLFGNILDDFLPIKIKPTLKTVDEIYKKMRKKQIFEQFKLVKTIGQMAPLQNEPDD